MAIIKGYVYYDPLRSLGPAAGIKGVRVVLHNLTKKINCATVTDKDGLFTFFNVPAGHYSLIEAHKDCKMNSEVNFLKQAVKRRKPLPKDPPKEYIIGVEQEVTRLDSVNTNEFTFRVSQEEIKHFDFFDAPVIDIPLRLSGVKRKGRNKYKGVKKGTFGVIPKNTYGVSQLNNFVYKNTRFCEDGFLSVTNLVNSCDECWPITDHTKGLRNGQFLALRGCKENTVFFRQTMQVETNTNYLFGFWAASFYNPAKASKENRSRLAIAIRQSKSNKLLYKKEFCPLKQQEIVTWVQLGCIFNSLKNEKIVIELINLNCNTLNGAYAIDDLSLYEIKIPKLINTTSNLVNEKKNISDLMLYFENCSKITTESLCLHLELPQYADFLPGSTRIGVCENTGSSLNPILGFGLPSLQAKSCSKVGLRLTSKKPLKEKDIKINIMRKGLFTENGDQYINDNDEK